MPAGGSSGSSSAAPTVERIAILNRGAAALRLLHAVRELSLARGLGLTTVAFHPPGDADALYAREADSTQELHHDPTPEALDHALQAAGVDAAIGFGPLAPLAAERCRALGITWLGTSVAEPVATASPGGPPSRQVEAQLAADQAGTIWVVGLRDATLWRGGRLVLVESAVPGLDPAIRAEIEAAATDLVRRAGLRGVATARFALDEGGSPALVAFEPWLTESHDVTEEVTGLDLAKLQLGLALGDLLEAAPPPEVGHAMGVGVHAEDPEEGFAPAPGRVALLRLPTGPGLRTDVGTAEGDCLPPETDAQVCRLVAHGRDQAEARVRLRRALADFVVVLDEGTTGRGFLLELLDQLDAVEHRGGVPDARWFDEVLESEGDQPGSVDLALLVAAADAYDAALLAEQTAFYAEARRGQPRVAAPLDRTVELLHRGVRRALRVSRIGPVTYRVRDGAVTVDADVERIGPFESRVVCGDRRAKAISSIRGTAHLIEVDGVGHRFTRDDGDVVRSTTPGVVVAVPVAEGDDVDAGSTVAVLESMKMETPVTAPVAGRIRRVLVRVNSQVPAGAPLVHLEPTAGAPAVDVETPSVAALVPPPPLPEDDWAARAEASRPLLANLVLGYDISPAEARGADAEQTAAAAHLGHDQARSAADRVVLERFADLQGLFRGHHDPDEHDLLVRSAEEYVLAYLRSLDPEAEGLPDRFVAQLVRALAHYGVAGLTPTDELRDALFWIVQARERVASQVPAVIGALDRLLASRGDPGPETRPLLDRLVAATHRRHPVVADLARDVQFHRFDEPVIAAARQAMCEEMAGHLDALAAEPGDPGATDARLEALVSCDQPLASFLMERTATGDPKVVRVALEVLTRRYYRMRHPRDFTREEIDGRVVVRARYDDAEGELVHVMATAGPLDDLDALVATLAGVAEGLPDDEPEVFDLFTWSPPEAAEPAALAGRVAESLAAQPLPDTVRRVVVAARAEASDVAAPMSHVTFRRTEGGFVEDEFLRGLHPLLASRLGLSRLRPFELERLPSAAGVYLFYARGRDNAKDERLFAITEVRDLTPVRDNAGQIVALPELERQLLAALAGIRQFQGRRPREQRLHQNRVVVHVWPPFDLVMEEMDGIARRLAPSTEGLGLEQVVVHCLRTDPATGQLRPRVLHLVNADGSGFVISEGDPPTAPLRPLDEYTQKVVSARRRGTPYPYELVAAVTAPLAGGRAEVLGGSFTEYDLDEGGRLVPVDRPAGQNAAGIVVGVISNVTERYPEGMRRVAVLGDPTRALGSLAEAECRRINAALDLAEELDLPLEWFAISAGARIAMDSGTENMDWIAAVLRRIIEFTQQGGEINVVVTGINVGAQPYWNAEATMLMHTRGILVMTPDSAMVLTGKQALDYSGGVSADDNFGIGGYERIMGPNGQAQYWAPDLGAAVGVLLAYYDHTYRAPGERFPRRAASTDPVERDVRTFLHQSEGSPFTTVGEIFSSETNPERKLPFDIRTVMRATADLDHEPLERWVAMRDADTSVVWDAHLGGYPVLLLGVESKPVHRGGLVPADGPEQWTSGTLFPMSSKKIARSINSASGNRPLVVLANLSGFDGSPDSMRSRQLEFGAEIGRAVVNFDGPIVFCVISRYHGGAFVVFSGKLNDDMEVIAVEGSRASVIGGAPAAAVVFAGDVERRTRADARVVEATAAAEAATGADRARQREMLAETIATVRSEKLGEVATEFDEIHSVERALAVGSVDAIIPAVELRPYLIAAVERGIEHELARQRSRA